jgi:hypothetical protein
MVREPPQSASTSAGSSIWVTSVARRARPSTIQPGRLWTCPMTGASRWRSTKAQRPPMKAGTSMAASAGTERPSPCPRELASQKVFVQFDGVYMDSTVYLNGTQVCARPYGYSSFECDLTSSCQDRRIERARGQSQQPTAEQPLVLGKRHLSPHLAQDRQPRARCLHRHASDDANGFGHERHREHRSHGPERCEDRPIGNRGKLGSRRFAGTEVGKGSSAATSVTAGKTADVTHTVTVSNPKLWSPSSPTMYSVVTTVSVGGAVVDTYTTPFGIRTFAFDAEHGLLAERHEDEAQRHVQSPRPWRPGLGRELSGHRENASRCSKTWAPTRCARPTTRPHPSCWTSPIASAYGYG